MHSFKNNLFIVNIPQPQNNWIQGLWNIKLMSSRATSDNRAGKIGSKDGLLAMGCNFSPAVVEGR